MYEKDFVGWDNLKQTIDKDSNIPTFNEREIWWCSIGINIGHEMDGKNRFYNRPILIIRKFNNRIFWGVPLTTKVKENPFYFKLDFQGNEKIARTRCAMLSHLRLYDGKRLHDKMGKISREEFDPIKVALKALL